MKRLLPALLLLSACAATTPPLAGPLPEGPVRIGETVRVGGPTVRPIAVIEDSRCPVDVVCVWAGRLIVRAEVGTGQGRREIELELGKPVPVADGMLTLVEAQPGKRQTQTLKPGDYRFTFTFVGSI